MRAELSSGDLARATGHTVRAIRFYEEEGLLRPAVVSEGGHRRYTQDDLERLEVILQLTRELGVNLAGVEIILNMREKMSAMQRQIEEFVATLNREMATHFHSPEPAEHTSLIPVIHLAPLVAQNAPRRRKRRSRDEESATVAG